MEKQSSQPHQLSVYYDGLCPVCTKEMNVYRRKPGQQRIRFVDIADPQFDAHKEGLDPKGIHKRFHAKTASGDVLEGVDAFVEIWRTLNIWKPMVGLATSPITRPLLDGGYHVFAKVRPWLRRKQCDSDYCAT